MKPDTHRAAPQGSPPPGFQALFRPATIAVAGVSSKSAGQGNKFIQRLRAAGYAGRIFPIHPTETELEGLPAYPSLADTPEPIDYAFIAIPAEAVPPLLAGARHRVRYAQVMSSGFGEGGRGGGLRDALLRAAQEGGMRLLGPNCMGIYSPAGRVTFTDGQMGEPGAVGVLSQSGGLSIDIVRGGEYRGLRFSGVVSLGNCLDVDPSDMLRHYLDDPGTRVIGAYIEEIRDGRRFFDLLRGARARKPIVLLKGGRTRQGQRAAASHTGSLASNDHVWRALAAQSGSVLVDTMEEFIDALVALEHESAPASAFDGRVVLFGNGGGASVLASDALGRAGIEVPQLGAGTVDALRRLDIPAGAGIENPLDVPANILERDRGALACRMLDAVVAAEQPGAVIMHLNLPVIAGYRQGELLDELVRAAIRLRAGLPAGARLWLVLRSTGQPELEALRQTYIGLAMRAGIPVFLSLPAVAQALAALQKYSRFRQSRTEKS
ncbi:acyl-CoA synthetase [Bordetella petrii]|nr:acyl-CoA synthetase [Bordetella petrii]